MSNKPNPRRQRIDAYIAKNLDGKGWSAADFGMSPAPAGPSSAPAPSAKAPSLQGASGQASIGVISSDTPASAFLTPEEQKKIVDGMGLGIQPYRGSTVSGNIGEQVGSLLKGGVSGATDFIGNLFNYDDVQESAVETVWDGIIRPIANAYNVTNQALTWARTAAPGGVQTIDWSTAQNVNSGVAAVAIAAAQSNDGGPINTIMGLLDFMNPATRIGKIGGDFAAALQRDAPHLAEGLLGDLGKKTFDLNNREQVDAASASPLGKVLTGTQSMIDTTMLDPLVLAGKVAKFARIKYLDEVFSGENGAAKLADQLASSIGKPRDEMAPIAATVDWAIEEAADGSKVVPRAAVAQRFKMASNGALIADMLQHTPASDPETAHLIVRYLGKNDVDAGAALAARRPALASAIAMKQREKAYAMLARDPEKQSLIRSAVDQAEKRIQAKIDDIVARGEAGSVEHQMYLTARDTARDTARMIDDGSWVHGFDDSPKSLSSIRAEIKDLIQHDKDLSAALESEFDRISQSGGGFTGAVRGFASDTKIGRLVEGNRRARATAGYQAATTRGAMVGTGKMLRNADGNLIEEMKPIVSLRHPRGAWVKDEYGNGLLTRTVRLWRWAGEENPSGAITLRGNGALDSWKEIAANINDLDIYAGKARRVVIEGVEYSVGGRARGEQLLNDYISALRLGVEGADSASFALTRFEDEVFKDIGMWHGMSKDEVAELMRQTNGRRAQTLSKMRGTGMKDEKDAHVGFWPDEDGGVSLSPWLETHLQNGTFIHNFKAINKKAAHWDSTGGAQKARQAADFAKDTTARIYNAFNDVWRPVVLFRGGYPVRNNIEGLFRATAFTFSLDPIRYSLANMGYAIAHPFTRAMYRRAGAKAVNIARAGDLTATPMPKAFYKWRTAQIDAADLRINEYIESINTIGDQAAPLSASIREFMLDHYRNLENRAVDEWNAAKAAGAGADELAEIDAKIAHYADGVQRINAIERAAEPEFPRVPGVADPKNPAWDKGVSTEHLTQQEADAIRAQHAEAISNYNTQNINIGRVAQHLDDEAKLLADLIVKRELLLNDPVHAAHMFQQQAPAIRRSFDGVMETSDLRTVSQAFDRNSNFTPSALANLSSDGSNKSIASSRMEALNALLTAQHMRTHVSVDITKNPKEYWKGLTAVLTQIKHSQIGEMAIQGSTPEEIADFLWRDKSGREILRWIVHQDDGLSKLPPGATEYEHALEIAHNTIERFNTVAPSEALRTYMKTAIIDKNFTPELVQSLMGDAVPAQKIIGNIAQEVGTPHFMDMVRKATSAAMRWIGTYPEDAFTRSPFYGIRKDAVFNELWDDMLRKVGPDGHITNSELQIMQAQAHRRALKDTKEWLYTIERRTNLGSYGEVAIPFISAMQNSVTTIGRLIWSDPSVAVIAARLWMTPNNMDLTNENGDIMVPVPHGLIPDWIEDRLGITNLNSMPISMASAASIILGGIATGQPLQAGPVVAVPTSAMVQYGLGMSLETPGWLSLGLPDSVADDIWSKFKTWAWGDYGGVSPNPLEQILPATGKRADQLLHREGNNAWSRIWAMNMMIEVQKYRGGLRPNMPDPDEITSLTNGLSFLQFMNNGLATIPPQYDFALKPLQDEYNRLRKEYPNDADRMMLDLHGPDLLAAMKMDMTNNIAGMPATLDAVRTSHKFADVIAAVAPSLEKTGDLSVLAALTYGVGQDGTFDQNAQGMQLAETVPGTRTHYREIATGQQAVKDAYTNAAWAEWSALAGRQGAKMALMPGVTNVSQVPQFVAERAAFVARKKADPMYGDWVLQFDDANKSRTHGVILLMQKALSNQEFVDERREDPIWRNAWQYLQYRNNVMQALKSRPGTTFTTPQNYDIRQYWDQATSVLYSTGGNSWQNFYDRWLTKDAEPDDIGVTFGTDPTNGAN